jgi:hypothetical protein
MLTQYDELRVARGRTLALEHDTTEEEFSVRSSFGILLFLHSISCPSTGSRRSRGRFTDVDEDERSTSGDQVTSRKQRRKISTDLEQETGAVDLEPTGMDLMAFEDESRVSDIELARGDLHGSRSSMLSKRMSGFSLGSRFEEDELPAFGEQDIGIEAPKISFGGESGIGTDLRESEMEMGGGFDAFDNVLDESSQRTSEVSAIAAASVREERKSIDDEESKQRVARDRASFRLSLLMGEGEDDEGQTFSRITALNSFSL